MSQPSSPLFPNGDDFPSWLPHPSMISPNQGRSGDFDDAVKGWDVDDPVEREGNERSKKRSRTDRGGGNGYSSRDDGDFMSLLALEYDDGTSATATGLESSIDGGWNGFGANTGTRGIDSYPSPGDDQDSGPRNYSFVGSDGNSGMMGGSGVSLDLAAAWMNKMGQADPTELEKYAMEQGVDPFQSSGSTSSFTMPSSSLDGLRLYGSTTTSSSSSSSSLPSTNPSFAPPLLPNWSSISSGYFGNQVQVGSPPLLGSEYVSQLFEGNGMGSEGNTIAPSQLHPVGSNFSTFNNNNLLSHSISNSNNNINNPLPNLGSYILSSESTAPQQQATPLTDGGSLPSSSPAEAPPSSYLVDVHNGRASTPRPKNREQTGLGFGPDTRSGSRNQRKASDDISVMGVLKSMEMADETSSAGNSERTVMASEVSNLRRGFEGTGLTGVGKIKNNGGGKKNMKTNRNNNNNAVGPRTGTARKRKSMNANVNDVDSSHPHSKSNQSETSRRNNNSSSPKRDLSGSFTHPDYPRYTKSSTSIKPPRAFRKLVWKNVPPSSGYGQPEEVPAFFLYENKTPPNPFLVFRSLNAPRMEEGVHQAEGKRWTKNSKEYMTLAGCKWRDMWDEEKLPYYHLAQRVRKAMKPKAPEPLPEKSIRIYDNKIKPALTVSPALKTIVSHTEFLLPDEVRLIDFIVTDATIDDIEKERTLRKERLANQAKSRAMEESNEPCQFSAGPRYPVTKQNSEGEKSSLPSSALRKAVSLHTLSGPSSQLANLEKFQHPLRRVEEPTPNDSFPTPDSKSGSPRTMRQSVPFRPLHSATVISTNTSPTLPARGSLQHFNPHAGKFPPHPKVLRDLPISAFDSPIHHDSSLNKKTKSDRLMYKKPLKIIQSSFNSDAEERKLYSSPNRNVPSTSRATMGETTRNQVVFDANSSDGGTVPRIKSEYPSSYTGYGLSPPTQSLPARERKKTTKRKLDYDCIATHGMRGSSSLEARHRRSMDPRPPQLESHRPRLAPHSSWPLPSINQNPHSSLRSRPPSQHRPHGKHVQGSFDELQFIMDDVPDTDYLERSRSRKNRSLERQTFSRPGNAFPPPTTASPKISSRNFDIPSRHYQRSHSGRDYRRPPREGWEEGYEGEYELEEDVEPERDLEPYYAPYYQGDDPHQEHFQAGSCSRQARYSRER